MPSTIQTPVQPEGFARKWPEAAHGLTRAPLSKGGTLERNFLLVISYQFLASLQPDARDMRECVARFLKTQQRPPRSASLWIGPEGDFSLAEIEQINGDAGAQPISLGPWVLRTDTATIASLAILNHEIRAARLPTRERT